MASDSCLPQKSTDIESTPYIINLGPYTRGAEVPRRSNTHVATYLGRFRVESSTLSGLNLFVVYTHCMMPQTPVLKGKSFIKFCAHTYNAIMLNIECRCQLVSQRKCCMINRQFFLLAPIPLSGFTTSLIISILMLHDLYLMLYDNLHLVLKLPRDTAWNIQVQVYLAITAYTQSTVQLSIMVRRNALRRFYL